MLLCDKDASFIVRIFSITANLQVFTFWHACQIKHILTLQTGHMTGSMQTEKVKAVARMMRNGALKALGERKGALQGLFGEDFCLAWLWDWSGW